MSALLRTIQAFPRGRTIEELQSLVGATFCHAERMSVLSELDSLLAARKIWRTSDGRWLPVAQTSLGVKLESRVKPELGGEVSQPDNQAEPLVAAPFSVRENTAIAQEYIEFADTIKLEPAALLRYYRSALRSDPRGALTENVERHGHTWHLISGTSDFCPTEGNVASFTLSLDDLADEFRTALLKKEANENALAVGWPVSIGRKSGVPTIWPVGLIAASWERSDGMLLVEIPADDILVNPNWIKGMSDKAGWRQEHLASVFDTIDGVGLQKDEFASRLTDAAATLMKGDLQTPNLVGTLNANDLGVFQSAALFLPDEISFTAGAIDDLDEIASWNENLLGQTALAPILGLEDGKQSKTIHPINVGPLNAEQIEAVREACLAPLTVVTGPPGTGKSQTIVSTAASVLAVGGSVLVASKSHSALDAVEDRLGSLAADTPFLVRTLNPYKNIDVSFAKILGELVSGNYSAKRNLDEGLVAQLFQAARQRLNTLDRLARRAELECNLADIHDQIEARKSYSQTVRKSESVADSAKVRLWQKLKRAFLGLFLPELHGRENSTPKGGSINSRSIQRRLARLRAQRERNKLGEILDVVEQTNQLAELSEKIMPVMLANRATVSFEARNELDQQKADFEFSGTKRAVPSSLVYSVIDHRPLWLASILGAPRRIPLEPALFDLVIFDEASRCDIGSALPLFARAKRAVVVGDNKQLNFIAQLGRAHDRNLMQAQGLPVKHMGRFAQSQQSLFDFARRVPVAQHVLLMQQYRSAGPIVDYISKEFYGNKLKTAFDPKSLKTPKNQEPGIAWTDVPAPVAPGRNNENPAEIAAIVDHLDRLLVAEGYEGSVGVTSPFRGQVAAIQVAIRQRIPEQKLIGAEFMATTVDGFQGQERDVILFSPTLGASTKMSSVTFVQRDYRRLNVAISRARAIAHVFGDLRFARTRKVRALAELAAAATEPRSRVGEGVFDSHWERILYHALKNRGCSPVPQYEIAGRRLDFALFGTGDIKLDLEVDGRHWHQNTDGSRKISDYWRDHQLISLGWRVRRFWVDELAEDLETCLDTIERDLT